MFVVSLNSINSQIQTLRQTPDSHPDHKPPEEVRLVENQYTVNKDTCVCVDAARGREALKYECC